jgi:hypothetical protein
MVLRENFLKAAGVALAGTLVLTFINGCPNREDISPEKFYNVNGELRPKDTLNSLEYQQNQQRKHSHANPFTKPPYRTAHSF